MPIETNDIDRQELSDRTDTRHRIGTDTRGRDHYADPTLGAVWVVDDDRLVHVERTTHVSAWVETVRDDDQLDWRDCTYSDQPTGEWLVEQIAEVA